MSVDRPNYISGPAPTVLQPHPIQDVKERLQGGRRKESEGWHYKFSGGVSYGSTLASSIREYLSEPPRVFTGRLFERFLAQIEAESGRELTVLDLMAYGGLHRDKRLKGLAVGLTDGRKAHHKIADQRNGTEFIRGNVLSPKTWREVQAHIDAHGPFNLVTCRPVAAISAIPQVPEVLGALISRVYATMDPHYSVFVTQLHYLLPMDFIGPEASPDYIARMAAMPGVTPIYKERSSFMLIREEGSPDNKTFRDILFGRQ